MSCARGERRESDEEMYILFLLLSFWVECALGALTGNRVKRQPPQKTRRGKISSLFVRRARSLLESALIGREEHDDAVVKVVGEEEEEVELGESEKKSREDQQQQQEQTCRGKR